MVQWIQDKSDQDWYALDEHIHLVTSKEKWDMYSTGPSMWWTNHSSN